MPRNPITPADQFLTLTFNDSYSRFTPETLWYKTMPIVIKHMKRISPDDYHIFPELQRNGMLHYHIICRHHNFTRMKAFIGHWRRKYGKQVKWENIKPKTRLNVFIYCRKETQNMMNEILPTRHNLWRSYRVMRTIVSHLTGNQVINYIIRKIIEKKELQKKELTQDTRDLNRYLEKMLSDHP